MFPRQLKGGASVEFIGRPISAGGRMTPNWEEGLCWSVGSLTSPCGFVLRKHFVLVVSCFLKAPEV